MSDPQQLAERMIAYFVELHQNSAIRIGQHEHKPGHIVYRIEGKARPMLVSSVAHSDHGCRWYRVLRITTRRVDTRGRIKPNLYSIGPLVNGNKTSFVDADSFLMMPDTLLHKVDGKSPVIKTLDRNDYNPIIQIVNTQMMKNFKNAAIR